MTAANRPQRSPRDCLNPILAANLALGFSFNANGKSEVGRLLSREDAAQIGSRRLDGLCELLLLDIGFNEVLFQLVHAFAYFKTIA